MHSLLIILIILITACSLEFESRPLKKPIKMSECEDELSLLLIKADSLYRLSDSLDVKRYAIKRKIDNLLTPPTTNKEEQ